MDRLPQIRENLRFLSEMIWGIGSALGELACWVWKGTVHAITSRFR